MSHIILLPVISGLLMGMSHIALKRLVASLPFSMEFSSIVKAVLVSHQAYLFILLNLIATGLYIVGLRTISLTQAYLAFISTMSITILILDALINRTALSTTGWIGAALGLGAVVLISAR
jgi:drug/metabolite transporter (DMT)-like permease